MTQSVRQSFDRAAPRYDAHAHQQRAVLEQLLALTLEHGPYHHVLDGGCGTGYLLQCLAQRGVSWQVTPMDLADGMCRRVAADGHRAVQGRLESLPFADESFDLVFSSLAVQWVAEPELFLSEARRVLKPGGLLAFSTYTNGTLAELKSAFAQIDGYDHTLDFLSRATWLKMLRQERFALKHMLSACDDAPYRDVRGLCEHLRGLGASQKLGQARRAVMTPRQFRAVEQGYPATAEGITAHWETGYFIARKDTR